MPNTEPVSTKTKLLSSAAPVAAPPASATPDLEPLAVRVADCARILGIGLTSVGKLIREGQVDSAMVCGRRVITMASIKRLLAASIEKTAA